MESLRATVANQCRVQVARSVHACPSAPVEQRLARAIGNTGSEHVHAVRLPRQFHPDLGGQRRKNVDALDVGVDHLASPLVRPLDEERHRGDIREGTRGRPQVGKPGPQAQAVIRRDHDELVVPDPRLPQPGCQRPYQGIDVLHLQQVPLVTDGDRSLVVGPGPAAGAGEHEPLGGKPLSRPQKVPRLVREQKVREVQNGLAGGSQPVDERVRRRAPAAGPQAVPAQVQALQEGIGRGEVSPVPRHRRQRPGGGLGQHMVQKDDGEVAQHRDEPGDHARACPAAQPRRAELGQRLVDVQAVAGAEQSEEVRRVVGRHRQLPGRRVVAGDDRGQGDGRRFGDRAGVAEPGCVVAQGGEVRVQRAVDFTRPVQQRSQRELVEYHHDDRRRRLEGDLVRQVHTRSRTPTGSVTAPAAAGTPRAR